MLTIPKMARAGLLLNIIGMVLVLLFIYFIAMPVWGIDPAMPAGWVGAGP